MSLKRVFIVTGDASADVHASHVVTALRERQPDIEVQAIGGEKLAELGVPLLHDQRIGMSVMGLSMFGAIPFHYQLGKRLIAFLKDWHPDAVLLIDYGVFNLWLAKALKKLGIKVCYYIPPQLWASRRHRLKTIQRYVDRVFCIFPFEETLYKEAGVPVTFVGHPLLESLPAPPDREAQCREWGLDPSKPIVGVFPGSRLSEIKWLMQAMIRALPLIREKAGSDIQFVLAKSGALKDDAFNQVMAPVKHIADAVDLKIVTQQNHAVLGLSKAILAASGTVTLEAALYGVPSVISYRGLITTYWVFKLLCYVNNIGLPNLLIAGLSADASARVLPELWMDQANPVGYCEAILPFLSDSPENNQVRHQLADLKYRLGQSTASVSVAEGILAMVGDEAVTSMTAKTPSLAFSSR